MIHLIRHTKRGPNIVLGDAIYQTSSSQSLNDPATYARIRLATGEGPSPWPIDLVVDAEGGAKLAKAIVKSLASFGVGGYENFQDRRGRVRKQGAALLRQFADELEADTEAF